MPFDPVAYGQMLDEALGQRPTMGFRTPQDAPMGGTIDSAPMGGGQSLQQAPSPGSVTARAQIGAPQNNSSFEPIAGTNKGMIKAKPPFEIKYRKGGLDNVKTFSDVMDAMTPSSQRQYMNWWEQQHGAINQRWNQLQQELGQRPDPNADLSRKEQFRMLMEFGIELMRRSGQPNAGGEAFAQAYGGARGRKQQATADYDTKSALVQKGRAEDLKSIGTYGEALKGQSDIDQNEVQMQEAQARMKAAGRRKPEIISADQGTYDYDPETRQTTAITGIDGKPLTNLKVGSRGGIGRDARTANQKNIEDLVDRGVPEQLALDIVYRRVSDPRKMWADIYRDRRRQYASDAEAKQEADEIMARFYGDDWERKPTNAKIDNSDPLGLRD